MAPILLAVLSKALNTANTNLSQLKANAGNKSPNTFSKLTDIANSIASKNSGISNNGVV